MRLLVLTSSFVLYASGVAAQSPISRLDWLAGCWKSETPSTLIEELWMKPRGGMMMGMSRTIRAGKVEEYEALRIYERDGTLVFAAQPSGQPPAEFVAKKGNGPRVVFENAGHDFPQRIIYGPGAGDSLLARIEGKMNGTERGIDYKTKRDRCGP